MRNVGGGLHYVTTGRVVYYLLSLLRVSDEHDFLRAPVLLHTFAAFEDELLEQCAEPLIKGIGECMRASPAVRQEMATSPDFWDLLHKLHALPVVSAKVFEVLDEMVTQQNPPQQHSITVDNYEKAIALLDDFATAGSVGAADERRRDAAVREKGKGAKMPKSKHKAEVERGAKALTLVQSMTHRVPSFITQSQLEPTEAWTAYWSPIFRSITKQCLNPCRQIRSGAFSALRQALLSDSLLTPDLGQEGRDKEWKAVFDEILFPLVGQLLKPEVFGSDKLGMGETRVQAAQLLCKVFLFYVGGLREWDGFVKLWGNILQVMDRLVNSGQGDTLVSFFLFPGRKWVDDGGLVLMIV
jgi:brefeldin A-resistance guanine nucleotide exchange factor 1